MGVRDYFPAGINMYVPAAKYSADIDLAGMNWVSLGTPAADDDDLLHATIDADAVATTETTIDWTADSPYGRTLKLTPSGDPGANGTIDVYGYDYLGQLMIERVVPGGAGSVISYLKKAFKKVFKTVIVVASSNAVTYKLGTASRLGLPYKGFVMTAREATLLVPVWNVGEWVWVDIAAADSVAGGSSYVRAPFPGYVKTLKSLSGGGGSTNDPVVTVELGGAAITGLTVTVDTSAAAAEATDTPTTAGYRANNRFVAGGLIEIVHAAAASASGYKVGLELQPVQYTEMDLTDPQTNATADPRGLYHPIMTLDDAAEIEVGLMPDNYVNSSGNGGLFGIKHYGG